MTPYKVIVVDDSAFMRKIISDLIEKDPAFQVVDTAVNGREAVDKITIQKPDIVTMDVEMPEMNGLEALKIIMAVYPLPVVMLSGINEEGMKETIMALESGAFDFIRKPSVAYAQHIDQVGEDLLEQLKAAMTAKERRAVWQAEEEKKKEKAASSMVSPVIPFHQARNKKLHEPRANKNSSVKPSIKPEPAVEVSRQLKPRKPKTETLQRGDRSKPAVPDVQVAPQDVVLPSITLTNSIRAVDQAPVDQIIAIGCSTGGPRALKTLLENIPADIPAPVVIVQHMPPNFTKSLAQRLNTFSPLEIVEAEQGMKLEQGRAYIAPGGFHLKVVPRPDRKYMISLSEEDPVNGHRPSVDMMFESLVPLTSLKRHLVLMTGMGSDGARMMKCLYDDGVTSTFAESEETCVVYGMPRSAVELKCVRHLLPLQEIAAGLVQALGNGK